MPKKATGVSAKNTPKNKSKKTQANVKKAAPRSASAVVSSSVKLPNVLSLAYSGWLTIWRNRKTLSIIILIYGLVYLVLVLGLSSPSNITSLKKEFSSVFSSNSFYSTLTIFGFLIGSTTSSATPDGSAYQVFIVIIASLSIIWALRQFYMGAKIRARDSYYQGLFPLAPYILVILFIALELIPLAAGLGLYGLLVSGGIAVTVLEKVLSIILVLGLAGLSFYLISSSIIALYIVTLPNMTPLKALRSAKGLVKGRRWSVFRKIIFLPLLLVVVISIIMLPFIAAASGVAPWIFFVLTLIALVYIHSYLYGLYRGLLNDKE